MFPGSAMTGRDEVERLVAVITMGCCNLQLEQSLLMRASDPLISARTRAEGGVAVWMAIPVSCRAKG